MKNNSLVNTTYFWIWEKITLTKFRVNQGVDVGDITYNFSKTQLQLGLKVKKPTKKQIHMVQQD